MNRIDTLQNRAWEVAEIVYRLNLYSELTDRPRADDYFVTDAEFEQAIRDSVLISDAEFDAAVERALEVALFAYRRVMQRHTENVRRLRPN